MYNMILLWAIHGDMCVHLTSLRKIKKVHLAGEVKRQHVHCSFTSFIQTDLYGHKPEKLRTKVFKKQQTFTIPPRIYLWKHV